mgnify:FL=1
MRKQIGGDHYQRLDIEPLDFFRAVSEDGYEGFLRFNAMKYLTRYPQKGGIGDLRKAHHYCELLIELYEHKQMASHHNSDDKMP